MDQKKRLLGRQTAAGYGPDSENARLAEASRTKRKEQKEIAQYRVSEKSRTGRTMSSADAITGLTQNTVLTMRHKAIAEGRPLTRELRTPEENTARDADQKSRRDAAATFLSSLTTPESGPPDPEMVSTVLREFGVTPSETPSTVDAITGGQPSGLTRAQQVKVDAMFEADPTLYDKPNDFEQRLAAMNVDRDTIEERGRAIYGDKKWDGRKLPGLGAAIVGGLTQSPSAPTSPTGFTPGPKF
jgi:hypothetical protein